MGRVGTRHDVLDDEYSALVRSAAAQVGEDLNALLVVPVVQDELQQVGVGRGYVVEHVTGDIGAAAAQTHSGCPESIRILENSGEIENGSGQVRVAEETTTQEVPVSAGDVAEVVEAGEVVGGEGFEDPIALGARVAAHRLIEDRVVGGVLLGVLEGHAAELAGEGVLFAVADHGGEMLPEGVMLGTLF